MASGESAQLQWVWTAGLVWFAVFGAAAFVVLGLWMWNRLKRHNGAHLLAAVCLVVVTFYAAQFLDWGFKLRTPDGLQPSMVRGVVVLVAYTLYSWLLAETCWLEFNDAAYVVGLHALAGVANILTDVCARNVCYFAWASQAVMLIAANVFLASHARNVTFNRYVLVAGWVVMWVGTPVVQLISYTALGWLDTAPSRVNTEIAYLCVWGVGLVVYGYALTWFFQPQPEAVAVNTAAPPPPGVVRMGSGAAEPPLSAELAQVVDSYGLAAPGLSRRRTAH